MPVSHTFMEHTKATCPYSNFTSIECYILNLTKMLVCVEHAGFSVGFGKKNYSSFLAHLHIIERRMIDSVLYISKGATQHMNEPEKTQPKKQKTCVVAKSASKC